MIWCWDSWSRGGTSGLVDFEGAPISTDFNSDTTLDYGSVELGEAFTATQQVE